MIFLYLVFELALDLEKLNMKTLFLILDTEIGFSNSEKGFSKLVVRFVGSKKINNYFDI
jgi:hypothetical protein